MNTSNSEETIYSDSDVTVTTSRVLCAGTTYELGNITSVKMGETHPNAIPTLVAIVIGICVLVTALARLEFNAAVVFLFVVGIALIAFAVRHIHQLTPDYHLFISSRLTSTSVYVEGSVSSRADRCWRQRGNRSESIVDGYMRSGGLGMCQLSRVRAGSNRDGFVGCMFLLAVVQR